MFDLLFRRKDQKQRELARRKRNAPPPTDPDWGFGKMHPSRRRSSA